MSSQQRYRSARLQLNARTAEVDPGGCDRRRNGDVPRIVRMVRTASPQALSDVPSGIIASDDAPGKLIAAGVAETWPTVPIAVSMTAWPARLMAEHGHPL